MKISYHSHIGGLDLSQGYGTAGFGIVTALKKLGFDVPFNDPHADILLNFTQPPYYQFHGTGQYNIGYTPWESTLVEPGWIPLMNAVDEMWTTSPLIARWFNDAGCTQDIKVFEHGINHDWAKRFRRPHGKVRFLHVGAEAVRKGGQMAFDAFIEAFGKNNSNVSLTFKTHASYTMIRRYEAPGLLMKPQDYSKNVHHIYGDFTLDRMIALFHNYDVLVYPSCLSSDTEILTPAGWRGIGQVSRGDIVNSVDIDTMTMHESPIQEYIEYNHTGEMLSIKNSSHDILVTMDHDIYDMAALGKIKKVKARDIASKMGSKGKHYIPVSVDYTGGYSSEYITREELGLPDVRWNAQILPEKINVRALLELTGWYISEGSMYKGTVNIAQIKDRSKYDRIVQCVEGLGLHPIHGRADASKSICVSIQSKDLAFLFEQCGKGALSKRIPEWAMAFDKNNLEYLFRGMMFGDGTNYHNNSGSHNISYYTSSDHLKDDMQRLCVLLGYRTNCWLRPGETQKTMPPGHKSDTFPNWQIGIARKKTSGSYRLNEHVSVKNYDGKVWCIKNERGTIITRRNGKISVLGNCGEGFGLIPLQALATGMPTIQTSTWAPYNRFVIPELNVGDSQVESPWPYEHPGDVLEPQYNDLVHAYRYAYENFAEVADKAYYQADQVHKEYDWDYLVERQFMPIVSSL